MDYEQWERETFGGEAERIRERAKHQLVRDAPLAAIHIAVIICAFICAIAVL